MNKNKRIFFPVLFINLISYFILHAPSAQAQSALGLSAIPPRLEVTLNPGEVITREIKVRNESKVEKILSTTAKDFVVTDDKGTPVQIDSPGDNYSNRWAASAWLQLSQSQIKVKPGETKSLILTILAPEDAAPGGHYAMVLHSPKNEVALTETGAAIETYVGTLVYITIPGDITQDASVREFSAPRFSEYGPIDFKSIITNLSDIHISPVGSIAVKSWLGLPTANLPLEKLNIFPYTNREFQNTLNKKFLFGRYQAKLNAAYGTSGGLLAATLYFWVIPWKLLLTLAAIIAIVVTLIILKKRSSPPQIQELEKELDDLKKKYRDKK